MKKKLYMCSIVLVLNCKFAFGTACRDSPLVGAITIEPRQSYEQQSIGPTMQTTGGPNGIVRNTNCRKNVTGGYVECSVNVHPAVSWSCTAGTLSAIVAVQTVSAGVEGQQHLWRITPNYIDLGLDIRDRCDGDYFDGNYVGFTSC